MRSKAAATAKQMRTGCDEAIGGETPPMYDVRFTMYDLNASARCADFFGTLTHEEWVE